MRRKTWPSLAALFACLLIAVHAENGVDDALQPNFLPSSGARNSLGSIFVEEKATVHAEEGSAAKLLAEIEAQEAASSSAVAEDDGPPVISHHDAESLTHTLMAALRGADPTEAFHEMAAANAADAAAAVAAEQPEQPEQSEQSEQADLPSFLQQKESASAARIASMVGNKRVEVEDDKAEDISQDSEEDKEEEEDEHPDPFGLHHAADAPQAAAGAGAGAGAAAASTWPNYFSPAMYAQQGTDPAANDRFKQQMAYNPYALYAAYFQQFAQAAQPHHKKHHHHHHHEEEEEQDAHADKPASPNAPAGDAMRFKEKEHASRDEDDDGDGDDDGDDEDGDDDGDDDDDDGEERRRRERKRKQEQQKLKYDDGMNKARFEQINLDIENMKSFTSPRQSGYSAPVDSTPVSTPAAIPLSNAPSPYHPLFNAPAQPQAFQAAPYPQAIPNPGSAPAYPSLIAISQQAMPQPSAVNANPNGVPMPYFPPTSAPPPAPNQVPVAAQTVNGVYPPSMVMPSTAAMPFAADGMTQSPAVNPSAPTMNPNAPTAPGLSNYPFGGTNFLELESVPLPSSAIHAHVDAIARHPRHPNVRSRLTEQHFEEFPLLQ